MKRAFHVISSSAAEMINFSFFPVVSLINIYLILTQDIII